MSKEDGKNKTSDVDPQIDAILKEFRSKFDTKRKNGDLTGAEKHVGKFFRKNFTDEELGALLMDAVNYLSLDTH